MQYTGAGPVDIDFLNKKALLISFPDAVNGNALEIDASGLPKGALLPAVTIAVDGVATAEIRTTCWQPAGEGDVHGHFVIDELGRVPGGSPKRPQASAAVQAVIQTAIGELVAIDRVVVQHRLDEVKGLVAVNPDRQANADRDIAKAEGDMVRAVAYEAAGKPEQVISRFKKVWSHAAKARRQAEKR